MSRSNDPEIERKANEKRSRAALGNSRTVTHGLRPFEDKGPRRLAEVRPETVERYAELKRLVRSNPGRRELREELAARAAMLVDIAFSELIQTHERGESIWDTPVIKRAGTYMAELRRVLDTFSDDEDRLDSADAIMRIIENDPTSDT